MQLKLKILVLKKETMSEVKFASNFSFETHVTSLCKKESQKLYALTKKMALNGF